MSPPNHSSAGNKARILTSQWGGLSTHLIAKFYPLKRVNSGSGWGQSREKRVISASDKFSVDDGYEVHCPITEGTKEMSFNWHSPFENAGAESRIPTLSAMLQSGSMGSTLQTIGDVVGLDVQNTPVGAALLKAEGLTGITKLNSTQVFTGMPPVKFTITLHFRALQDPSEEVRAPILQLEEWAVPQFLASEGLIAGAVRNGVRMNSISTVFPSVSPQIIGMRYGDICLEPLVIESVSEPFTNPRSVDGIMTSCSLQMSLATLTAIDRRDLKKMYV
jgi:hypothetical protein